MARIQSQYNAAQSQGLDYKQLQVELKRLRVKATGSTLDLKRRLLAYISAGAGATAAAGAGAGASASPTHPPDEEETAEQIGMSLPTPLTSQQWPSGTIDGLAAADDLSTRPTATARPAAAAASAAFGFGALHRDAVPQMFQGSSSSFGGGTGTGGGFDDIQSQSQSDDDSDTVASQSPPRADDDTSAAAAAAPASQTGETPARKGDKAAHFTSNCFVRVLHCIIEPENRTALGSMSNGKTRMQIDAGYDGWNDVAEMYNDLGKVFDHPQIGEDGGYSGSPRINIEKLDPNGQHRENRSAAQLKKKWAEMKKWLTVYFENWGASGQMCADVEEKSISDFLRAKVDRHPKEKVIKYCHLLVKGDEDLLSFASKALGKHGRESGASQDSNRDVDRAPKRGKHLTREGLVAAMSVETDSTKAMVAAAEKDAEANLLSSVTAMLVQLASVPEGNLKVLLEKRLEAALAQPAAPAETGDAGGADGAEQL